MTKDEIIQLAKQTGITWVSQWQIPACETKHLFSFANLIAAREREACAKLCDDLAELNRTSETDSMWQWGECAAAIRARKDTES